MSRYLASLTGLHSRNEATVQATQDWERGRISKQELESFFEQDVRGLIQLQKRLRFDYVSDGQLTMGWQDMFTPLVGGLEGLKNGPLVRWFNTNTFFYVPIVEGEIHSSGNALVKTLNPKLELRNEKLKVTLPDPLTFSELAEDRFYGSRHKLMFAYAEAIREEIAALKKGGVAYVQFAAPSLVARFREPPLAPDELERVGDAVKSAVKKTGVESGYFPYFGDAGPYLPDLFVKIPADDIGLDFTETDPRKVTGCRGGLIAGVANGRSGYVETVRILKAKLKAVPCLEDFERVVLTSSCDMRYVPRIVADKKLKGLAELKKVLEVGA